jgi:hypothetical protein
LGGKKDREVERHGRMRGREEEIQKEEERQGR